MAVLTMQSLLTLHRENFSTYISEQIIEDGKFMFKGSLLESELERGVPHPNSTEIRRLEHFDSNFIQFMGIMTTALDIAHQVNADEPPIDQ